MEDSRFNDEDKDDERPFLKSEFMLVGFVTSLNEYGEGWFMRESILRLQNGLNSSRNERVWAKPQYLKYFCSNR